MLSTQQLTEAERRSVRHEFEEFYQSLTFSNDAHLDKRLRAWERFYTFSRPYGALDRKSPDEALRGLAQ